MRHSSRAAIDFDGGAAGVLARFLLRFFGALLEGHEFHSCRSAVDCIAASAAEVRFPLAAAPSSPRRLEAGTNFAEFGTSGTRALPGLLT